MTEPSPARPPFAQYLAERFPVGAYLVLIGAMVLGASAAASASTGLPVPVSWPQLIATITILLGFFHLRVFDEHKDYERDLIAHPDRVLSRGLITLADLRKYAAAAIVLELGLNAAFGLETLAWVVAFILFSVGMFVEFGVGEWLNKHLVVYALSHNPIAGLMMCYTFALVLGHTAFPEPVVWYLLVATFTCLGFEIGRKMRAPADEKDGQDTYTQALGVPRATALLIGFELVAVAVTLPLLDAPWAQVALGVVAALMIWGPARFWLSQSAGNAKLCETTSTLGALAVYIIVAADGMARLGVSWS